MYKDDFIFKYFKASLPDDIDRTNIQLGTAFEKAGKSGPGIFTAVSFEHGPFSKMWEVLNPETNFQWSFDNGRVVIWLELRFLEEPPEDARKPRKPRSRAPKLPAKATTVPPEPIPSTPNTEEQEVAVKYEPISLSLEGFPQDQGFENDSEPEEEDEVQQDHKSPQTEQINQARCEEQARDAMKESEEQPARRPSKKRPRAPTIDSDDEPLVPRRSQREIRPTSKAWASRPSK